MDSHEFVYKDSYVNKIKSDNFFINSFESHGSNPATNNKQSIVNHFKDLKAKDDPPMLSNLQVPNTIYIFNKEDIIRQLSSNGTKTYNNSHKHPDGTASIAYNSRRALNSS